MIEGKSLSLKGGGGNKYESRVRKRKITPVLRKYDNDDHDDNNDDDEEEDGDNDVMMMTPMMMTMTMLMKTMQMMIWWQWQNGSSSDGLSVFRISFPPFFLTASSANM